ncbi:MAG TPA: hypothetical protein VNT53_06135 [Pseudolysinimonas sp.]|nr:hypothetical protein [Pseudolysinimonas sp.]
MSTEHEQQIAPHLTVIPFDHNISLYDAAPFHLQAQPWEFAGWRQEILSWRTSVGIGAYLNPTPVSYLRGPDTLRFLSDISANSFASFAIGSAKHAIMCNDDGNVVVHGMLLRTGEQEVYSMWPNPWTDYQLARAEGRYDVTIDMVESPFLFQVAGANSLETLEVASGDDLHDIRFIRFRDTTIDGRPVRVLRIGMAGGLAYEVHGKEEDAHAVYAKILEAGREFDIHRVGYQAYALNHTEAGFPQSGLHFPQPWGDDQEFQAFMNAIGLSSIIEPIYTRGSAGPDVKKRYANPLELGWGHMVKFDHDFIGREALERIAAAGHRKMVTLEWNKEDILDVHASQLQHGEPYLPMDLPHQQMFWPTPGKGGVGEDQAPSQWADDVLNDAGDVVGLSSGRVSSVFFREMLSLAMLDAEYAEEGTAPTLIWGDPGTRQKKIRVTVARFPYLNENRNENVDVETIPRRGGTR